MSTKPVPIPLEKVSAVIAMLRQHAEDLENMRKSLEKTGADSVPLEGWPTLLRGLVMFQSQCNKLVGVTAKSYGHNFELLLIPGQTMSPVKKQRNPDSKKTIKAADKKLNTKRNNKQA